MSVWPAIDEVCVDYEGIIIVLRPSLRAATYLERLHDGFPNLLEKVEQFDSTTIRLVVQIASIDKIAAQRLMSESRCNPLSGFVQATQGAILELCGALMPHAPEIEEPVASKSATKPMAWSDAFRELYRIATGWLGWTPEQAWCATPSEITEAFSGHIAKLKAIHGSDEVENDPHDSKREAQRQRNVEQGLDPEFDRAGLQSLKFRIG
jgi:hypothetical protein